MAGSMGEPVAIIATFYIHHTVISESPEDYSNLSDVGDVLGVVGLDHDLVVVGPQYGGPHAYGQVRGGHHVLLKRERERENIFMYRFDT